MKHRKIYGLILTLCLLLSSLQTATVYAAETPEQVDGYYQLDSAEDLVWFAEQVNAGQKDLNGMLAADIVVNENVISDDGTLNEGSYIEWIPIGDTDGYKGTFNGAGHTISGLYINHNEESAGVFADSSGVIKNLKVVDSYVGSDGSSVGGLVGYNRGTIDRCSFEGLVDAGSATYSYSTIGGLVGYCTSGSITNSFHIGPVKGGVGHVSGICGENYSSSIVIRSCYHAGPIGILHPRGDSFACGIALNPSNNVTNCYYDNNKFNGNAFSISDSGTNAGKATESFVNGEVAYLLGEAYGQEIGKDSYPILGGTKVYYDADMYCNHLDCNKGGYCNICGAYQPATLNEEGVYEIGNIGQLYWFAEQVNSGNADSNAVLVADITANRDVLEDDGTLNGGSFSKWNPIGTEGNAYNGTFDGQGYTISGLYRAGATLSYVGLFGNVGEKAIVKNVNVADSYFSGKTGIGGIAGVNHGSIENCTNSSTISGNNGIGGIVGMSESGSVTECTNSGNIVGESAVGGIVGKYSNTTVENCVNNGTVTETGNLRGDDNNANEAVQDSYDAYCAMKAAIENRDLEALRTAAKEFEAAKENLTDEQQEELLAMVSEEFYDVLSEANAIITTADIQDAFLADKNVTTAKEFMDNYKMHFEEEVFGAKFNEVLEEMIPEIHDTYAEAKDLVSESAEVKEEMKEEKAEAETDTEEKDTPKTGDSSNVVVWAMMMMAAIAVIVVAIRKKVA